MEQRRQFSPECLEYPVQLSDRHRLLVYCLVMLSGRHRLSVYYPVLVSGWQHLSACCQEPCLELPLLSRLDLVQHLQKRRGHWMPLAQRMRLVTGAEEAVPAAAFTVTLMTHFFMLFAETVTFAAPAFLPVMRIFFFTALTDAVFLLEILTFNFLFLIFLAFTVTVFPMDTVTLVLLTLILAAA